MERNSEKSVVRFLQQDQPLAPGEDETVGVDVPTGHTVPPHGCGPSYLQGIVEDGDARVVQAGI